MQPCMHACIHCPAGCGPGACAGLEGGGLQEQGRLLQPRPRAVRTEQHDLRRRSHGVQAPGGLAHTGTCPASG